MEFGRPLLVGIVLDVSPIHYEGTYLLDHLKHALVTWINEAKDPVRVYVSHPQWKQAARDQGESTYFVVSYREPLPFQIDKVFRDAVGVIGNDRTDGHRYVLLITDRFQAPQNYNYRQGFLMNDIRGYGCKICVYGVGPHYDHVTLAELAKEYGAEFAHLDKPADLGDKLKQLGV
jgi:hypothetical protein